MKNYMTLSVRLAALCLLAFALIFAGCATSNPAVTKAVVKTAVTTGVVVGVNQSPTAIPYLRAAVPVVCEAASGTNVAPQWIVAALETNAEATKWKTPEATLIFNSALGIYTALYEQYFADNVSNLPILQAWLGGICEGILAGLPTQMSGVLTRGQSAPPPPEPKRLPPHIQAPRQMNH